MEVIHLMRRLAQCPAEYLSPPKIGDEKGVHVDAVVADLVVGFGASLPAADQLEAFRSNTYVHREYLELVLVGCWLLADPELGRRLSEVDAELVAWRVQRWLSEELEELSVVMAASEFVHDGERREELSRRALRALDILPAAETQARARDRLTTLDSVERDRMMLATKQRLKRAEELRKKMAEKRAREAAARYTRE